VKTRILSVQTSSVHSIIDAMAQTKEGAFKIAAKKVGISIDEYNSYVSRGLKWCIGCRKWHEKSVFGKDKSRWDGLSAICIESRSKRSRTLYKPKPRQPKGRSFIPARNGDKIQARGRINYFVTCGLIPHPNELPCTDCGHIFKKGGRRHEYDHHKGYAAQHHEDVEPVCSMCHATRDSSKSKQTHCIHGHEFDEKNTGYKINGTRYCKECRRIKDRGRHDAAYWRNYRKKRKETNGKTR